MRLKRPTPAQAEPILRAFAAVTRVTSSVDERQAAMIAAARTVLGTDVEPGSLQPLSPAELAAAIDDPAIRSQIVQGMIVLSLLDEEVDAKELQLIEAFAEALAVAPDELRNMQQLVEGRTLALRFDVGRRVWFMERLKKAWREGGFRWLARTVATLALCNDEPLAAKYRALGELPPGSLGRTYFERMREQGFSLPGEKGSQVEPVFIHDLTHLLCGYGTDARGEILTAAFSAGNRHDDPFTYIFFVLCQFHLGMRFSPFAPSEQGAFDPEATLWAAKRGMEVGVDLSEDWDYWSDLGLPVAEVRAKLGMTLPMQPVA
ncbi:MAG: hypothetical protein K0V04_03485 [Deltaproteobacteria bacterium]|nr:hypothetical protein [Deltaproteobacteria bacterium]